MNTFIYSLSDPRDNLIKYIGKADNLNKRYYDHISDSKLILNNKKNDWIKKLKRLSLNPIIEIVDIVDIKEWEFWEKHYISLFKTWGFELKNMTIGGDGRGFGYKHSIETLSKMSLTASRRISPLKGKKRKLEFGLKISLSKKGKTTWGKGKTYKEMYGDKAEEEKNKRRKFK